MNIEEQIDEEINTIKDSLSILPKKTVKNKEKCLEYINSTLEEYKNKKQEYLDEINRRFEFLKKTPINSEVDLIKKALSTIDEEYFFMEYKTPYEKLGLDRLLYDISHFYKNDLDKVNQDILECISKLKETGIENVEFTYSEYAKEYTKSLLEEKSTSEKIHQLFEEIYWKCPDVITHIELNIKNLYLKNEKRIEKYFEEKEEKYLTQLNLSRKELKDRYLSFRRQEKELIETDKGRLLERFKQSELKVKDYQETGLKKIQDKLQLKEDINQNLFFSNIKKLEHSLEEYKWYLEFKYLIEDIKNRYQEKSKNKIVAQTKRKEIEGIEKTLFKLNKKIEKTINQKYFITQTKKETKVGELILQENEIIMNLKNKYEEWEESEMNQKIATKLTDDSSIYDALLISISNYEYLVERTKELDEKISKNQISSKIEDLKEFLIYPYITLVNNISIKEDKNIPMIISDRYKLLNINLEQEAIENKDSIDNLIKDCNTLIYGKIFKDIELNIKDVEFYLQIIKEFKETE